MKSEDYVKEVDNNEYQFNIPLEGSGEYELKLFAKEE